MSTSPLWTVVGATSGEVYSGRSEAKARRLLAEHKSTERTVLACNGQPWVIAYTPAIKPPTPGMHRVRAGEPA